MILNKRYWFILVTFLAMLFGAIPFHLFFMAFGMTDRMLIVGYSTVASYIIGTIIITALLTPEMHTGNHHRDRSSYWNDSCLVYNGCLSCICSSICSDNH